MALLTHLLVPLHQKQGAPVLTGHVEGRGRLNTLKLPVIRVQPGKPDGDQL